MITPLLQTALEPIVARHRLLRRVKFLAWSWFAVAVSAGAMTLAGIRLPGALVFVALWLVVVRYALRRADAWSPDYRAIARSIEAKEPKLHSLLVTAVEQQPDPKTGQLYFLQQRLIAEAIRASRQQQWVDAIPARRWAGAFSLHAIFLAAMIAALYWRSEVIAPQPTAEQAETAEAVSVTPGDATLERGSGLVVLAKFHRDVPGDATLVVKPQNAPEQRISLVKNLDDPVFGGGVPEVDGDLTYRVEYAGGATRDFAVKVFEHPRLERADARLVFPDYTRLPEKNVADTRRVSAVEGTKLGLSFQLNKPVKSAELIAKNQPPIPLTVDASKAIAALSDFELRASQTYELRLVDADGRTNKVPAQIVVDVLKNRRPELKFVQPKGDQRVSPLQEVAFTADAWDDFGMPAYGLTIKVASGESKDIVFGRDTKADERVHGSHMLKLEDAGVKPDQLVSWFLWAEDIGPDGKTRRTQSDIFFAEVRPFDEIFRRGDDSDEPGQGKGKGDETKKLAQLQKQIITATWNLQRSEPEAQKYAADESVIQQSQEQVLAQAAALAEELEQPRAKAFIETAMGEMKKASEQLKAAATEPAKLPPALDPERAAYDALLKLAAHEHQVSRSRGQQGEESSESSERQQLDQLEMKDDKKRYETKRQAEPQQNEQQRDQLAILNRLKELAQRQQDINERLKEMQTALQEAKTEREKEEIRRQLKRLQEEQQQLLADVDEARQKMEQSSSAAQLANERNQLEQTRNEAQKAAEAMEKNSPSQALASGTRAQRELQQLRDDFRKKTSSQFADEMREMRTDARELAKAQEELSKQLGSENKAAERRTLDGSSRREQLAEQFEQQQKGLGEISEKMKRVSEQAEAAEPLLARELYDALRKTSQAGTDETLKRAQQLAQAGYDTHARKFEEKARQEIEQMKQGVERAAESVLGNEAEALRQARAELDALTSQLEREIAAASPSLAQQQGEQKPGQQGASSQQSPNGEQKQPGEAKADSGEGAGKQPGEKPQPGQTASNGRGEPNGDKPGDPSQQQANASGSKPDQQGQPNQPGQSGQPGQTAQQRPGSQPGSQPGQQPGQQAGNQPGQQPGQPGQQPGDTPGQQPGQMAANGEGSGNGRGQQQTPNGQPRDEKPGAQLRELASAPKQRGGILSGAGGNGGSARGGGIDREEGPIRGDGYAQWSDRLRNVEEMLDQPELRNQVAQVREIARGVRAEFKRHANEPQWDLVKSKISAPLAELRDRVSEELARRDSKESLVPIDRDPVPARFAEQVRRYYEELGRSK